MTDFPDTHAAADPDRPAYIMAETDTVVTYRHLVDASRAVAALLWSRGLRHGDCVALLMENHVDFPKIAWAAQRIGLRYVTISTRLLPEEVAYILADSGARALFTSARYADVAAAASARVPAVRERFVVDADRPGFENVSAAVASVPDGVRPDEREGVDLLYSSGTTGRPKGVVAELPLAPLGTPPGVAGLLHSRWGIGRDSVYLSPAPLYHAAPLRFTMTVHRFGGTVIVMERFDAEAALAAIERYRVTHTQMVPTMFIRMLRLPDEQRLRYDLSTLRTVIHAAAPCPPDTKRAMIDWLGPIVHEFYSCTENALFTALDSQEWLAHPGSVGRAILGTPHILDDGGRELPPGEPGTIWSEGGLMFEYLNDPAKTAASRNERGWTTVGDIGYLDEDGYLYLADRRADLILSGGVNVYPREAEDALVVHPKVADAAVFGIPHDELGEVAHAVVVPAPGVAPDAALAGELLAYLRERLAGYKCPRAIDFEPELPRAATGKLYKRVLRERYAQQAAVAPS
ncbi:AMP-binding protein [Nocardia farcinica]|uniref:AMP-binding protein n=1 Tax=Nocardia farcinica TaxID=37329 RepID=UPI001893E146|nr:AMP-binding protein [Nocardia farcinica]MBF6382643.1 AMP-binding protein [Nocardia farcinica]